MPDNPTPAPDVAALAEVRFTVSVHRDDEEGCYYATAPQLDIVRDGETAEEAIAMCKEACEIKLESSIERGFLGRAFIARLAAADADKAALLDRLAAAEAERDALRKALAASDRMAQWGRNIAIECGCEDMRDWKLYSGMCDSAHEAADALLASEGEVQHG